jgi:hypothetical protein
LSSLVIPRYEEKTFNISHGLPFWELVSDYWLEFIQNSLPFSDINLWLESVICRRTDLKVCCIKIQYQLIVVSAEIWRPTWVNVNCYYIMQCYKFVDLIAETHFLLFITCFLADCLQLL